MVLTVRWRPAGLVVLLLALPAAGQTPRLAVIHGRVDIARPIVAADRRPTPTDPGDDPLRDPGARRRAVVYFETAPRGAFEDRDNARATMDQRNETFVPHLLAITVGTVVDFPNSDHIYHNVFSLSKTKRFDLGRYAEGHSKSVRFDRPGIVRVFCDIHSHMNAFILVFSHRFFDVTGEDGRYTIDRVPPGNYTLSAWYEGDVRDQRPITVGAETRSIEADFTVK